MEDSPETEMEQVTRTSPTPEETPTTAPPTTAKVIPEQSLREEKKTTEEKINGTATPPTTTTTTTTKEDKDVPTRKNGANGITSPPPPSAAPPPQTPNSSKEAALSKMNMLPKPSSVATRGRVVSLDRRDVMDMDTSTADAAFDDDDDDDDVDTSDDDDDGASDTGTEYSENEHDSIYSSAMSKSNTSKRSILASSSEDSDSSDGDSSYFSECLPSPKSAVKRTINSGNVGGGTAGAAPRSGTNNTFLPKAPVLHHTPSITSDASLSFSDEDDDDHIHYSQGRANTSALIYANALGGRTEINEDDEEEIALFPRRTNRACSTGSIVESASSEEETLSHTRSSDSSGSRLSGTRLTGIGGGGLEGFPGHSRIASDPTGIGVVGSVIGHSRIASDPTGTVSSSKVAAAGQNIDSRGGGVYDRRKANATGLSSSSDDEDGSSSFESSDPSVASELRAIGAKRGGGGTPEENQSDDAEDKKPSGRRTPVRDLPSASSSSHGNGVGGVPSGADNQASLRRFFSSPNSAAKAVEQEEQRLQQQQQQQQVGMMQQLPPQFMQQPQQQYIHPQPQHQLSPEQMSAWVSQQQNAATAAAAGRHNQFVHSQRVPVPMGMTSPERVMQRHHAHAAPQQQQQPHRYSTGGGSSHSNSEKGPGSRESSQTASLIYSDDDEDDVGSTGAVSGIAAAAAAAAAATGGGKVISSSTGGNGGKGSPAAPGGGGGGDDSTSKGDRNANSTGGDKASTHGKAEVDGVVSRSGASFPNESERSAAPQQGEAPVGEFKVYWRRWLMLLYMSILNLMSDWTCYSVAPIALLTKEAFGNVNAETLVTVFLGANAIATAAEPMILGRLGLRRTVVFGSLLLMLGSVIKSGGMPLIMSSTVEKGHGAWKLYLGFFLVGLSQPLYQCTPALLSASWFPEQERTMATGVALNSNQLGIGCAFVFGTLLVSTSDDIPAYFGLMSLISTIAFIGTAIQFDDAPPTPPSDSARVIRGTFEMRIPSMRDIIWKSVPASVSNIKPRMMMQRESQGQQDSHGSSQTSERDNRSTSAKDKSKSSSSRQRRSGKSKSYSIPRYASDSDHSWASRGSRGSQSHGSSRRSGQSSSSSRKKSSRSGGEKSRSSTSSRRSSREGRHSSGSRSRPRRHNRTASSENGLRALPPGGAVPAPSPALDGPTASVAAEIKAEEERLNRFYGTIAAAPSPMMPGPVGAGGRPVNYPADQDGGLPPHLYQGYQQQPYPYEGYSGGSAPPMGHAPLQHGQYGFPPQIPPYMMQQPRQGGEMMGAPDGSMAEYPNYHYESSPLYAQPNVPPYQMNDYLTGYPAPFQSPPNMYYGDPNAYYYQQQAYYPGQFYHPSAQKMQRQVPNLPPLPTIDEGAEPVITLTPHHLDINIRDDQIILSAKACFSRPGFVHSVVAFAASGIVINTLSTFMDYLVRLEGAGREYVGIVGGSFQLLIMISSLVIGKYTDRTRAYFSVTIGLLVTGAFALAECGVTLDADKGGDLRWALLVVAVLVGPLQPVSTELGVDVAYPLSENTVLVIQQLFSNLLSALFIPFFKAVRDIGTIDEDDMQENMTERPQYTFSFYLLIVVHACATVFFATFNGRYLRYEAELAKKNEQERDTQIASESIGVPPAGAAFRPGSFQPVNDGSYQHVSIGQGRNVGDYAEENERLLDPPSLV